MKKENEKLIEEALEVTLRRIKNLTAGTDKEGTVAYHLSLAAENLRSLELK